MINNTNCYACNSENIVDGVHTQEYVSVCYKSTVEVKEFGLYGKKIDQSVLETTALKAAICRDCGSVRLYVIDPKKNWLTTEQYNRELIK